MAQTLTDDEVKKLQQETRKKINDKRSKQKALGKEFIVDKHGYGSGVIPESEWKNLPGRSIEDPKAVA